MTTLSGDRVQGMTSGVELRALIRKGQDPEQRFWAKVNKTDTCWLWTAVVTHNGYGKFFIGKTPEGKPILAYAHRWIYEQVHGPVAKGLTIDHLCHNRACVNVDHLEPVTQAENVRRAASRITHCPQGHEYTPENTRVGDGSRRCRACISSRQKTPEARALRAGYERARRARARVT